jgi:hypothetical protein
VRDNGDDHVFDGTIVRPLPRSPIVRGFGVTALLLTAFALSGGQAQAGCGDYHVVLPPAVDGHQAQAPVKPPCHGPNCSAQREEREPLLPPTPSTTTQTEQWARLHADLDTPPLPEWRSPVASSADLSVHRPLDIFHPPRLG